MHKLAHVNLLKGRRISLNGAVEQMIVSVQILKKKVTTISIADRMHTQLECTRLRVMRRAMVLLLGRGGGGGEGRRGEQQTQRGQKENGRGENVGNIALGAGLRGQIGADAAALAMSADVGGASNACNSARVVSVGMPRFASKKASHHL